MTATITDSDIRSNVLVEKRFRDRPRVSTRARARIENTQGYVKRRAVEVLADLANLDRLPVEDRERAERTRINRTRSYLRLIESNPDNGAQLARAVDLLRAVANDGGAEIAELLVDAVVELALAASGVTTAEQLDELLKTTPTSRKGPRR